MRVVKQKLRGHEGEITLVPDSLDDLWHLIYIVEPNDLVFAFTKRQVAVPKDKLRPEKIEKKPVRLGIRVEGTKFHKFSNRLRVEGVIEHGIDTGKHHTLNIGPGTVVSIIKRWRRDQLQRIEEAVKASMHPKVAIITIEEGEACIGVVRQYGVETLTTIRGTSLKRTGEESELFKDVAEQLGHMESAQFIIAGPGFIKEDFLRFLKQHHPEIAKRAVAETASSIGMSGFQEVLRRGAVDRIIEGAHITKEAKLMEMLLAEIAKDGEASYGMDDVRKAMEYGAIETLLIADEMLRSERREEIDKLLRDVEKARGKIVVFSTEFEPGKKLQSLGSIAALLRFSIG
ncbi:MAG: mRNA surveillance protein pelota [Methanosarcinales archaeon]|nr:MAG: mRNA surveillance protein pelota [Methanosarcinales archaeon]